MTKARLETYRRLLNDPAYVNNAVNCIAANLVNGHIKLDPFIAGTNEKLCPGCKTIKPLKDFWNNRSGSKGKYLYCIECEKFKRKRRRKMKNRSWSDRRTKEEKQT
jgi:hypothetical protein